LLVFVPFFSAIAVAQYFYVETQTERIIAERVRDDSKRANDAFRYWEHNDLKNFNKVPLADDTLLILTDGTVIDLQLSPRGLPPGLIPEVECPILSQEAFVKPVKVSYQSGPRRPEQWTLFAKRLDRGYAILGYSEIDEIVRGDEILLADAALLGSTVDDANRVGPTIVENNIAWALVTDSGALINGSARIPLKVRNPIELGRIANLSHYRTLGGKNYYVAFTNINDSSERFAATAVAFAETNFLFLALENLRRFSVSVAVLSITILLALYLFYSKRHEGEKRAIMEKHEQEKHMLNESVKSYFSPQLFQAIQREPEILTERRREIAVLFSDIRSFTTLSEQIPTQQLIRLLRDYFDEMTTAVTLTDGVVDKYIGDAVMAFWGAPNELPDAADRAVSTALEMVRRLRKLNEGWEKDGLPHNIDIGIGINFGMATVGNFGSRTRYAYTAIGDTVNTAARLEPLNKEYEQYASKIIISESTLRQLTMPIETRDLGLVQVRGRQTSVRIFQVITD
jgi:class 3 adenylate cyclase